MNVSCTSCSAKYGIPDEKVRGKKVKITCKHCGTAIVVDGTTLDAPAASPAAASPAAASPAAVPAPAKVAAAPAPAKVAPAPVDELSFDIAYPDDRQETLKLSELVSKYASGTLGDDAYVWREGMSDWKAPREVPEIDSALTAAGVRAKAAPAPTPYEEEEATKIQVSPYDTEDAGAWREPAKDVPSNPPAPFDLRPPSALPFEKPEAAAKPAAKAETAKPTAARRSAARGGADLFGDLAAAGSEDDESLGTDAKDPAPKLTGARNESSVLFSLDALVKQEQQAPARKPAPKQEDAAALLLGTDTGPNSIANVGTGAFGSAFAAPDFSAPVTAVPESRSGDDPFGGSRKKKGAGLWIALVVVLALGGGAAAMVFSGKLAGSPAPAPAPSAASVSEKPEAAPPASAEPATSAAPSASAAPAESTKPASGTDAAPAPAAPAAHSPAPAAEKPAETTPKPDAEAAAKPEKPAEKPAEKPPTPAESSAPPFDTAAAKAALGAAANNAGSCKTPDGPTGSGKVSVTFMPSGRATNTQVSGDLAGTAVGGCVAKLFRTTKVPPFSGDPVTVSKSFTVQ